MTALSHTRTGRLSENELPTAFKSTQILSSASLFGNEWADRYQFAE